MVSGQPIVAATSEVQKVHRQDKRWKVMCSQTDGDAGPTQAHHGTLSPMVQVAVIPAQVVAAPETTLADAEGQGTKKSEGSGEHKLKDVHDVERLRCLSRREFQEQCKIRVIKGNLKNCEMVDALLWLHRKEVIGSLKVPGAEEVLRSI